MAEEKQEKKGFWKEFREFIARGNILDMAVGIIIGGAFTAIVNALCNNILKPVINKILALIFSADSLTGIYTFLSTAYTTDETGAQVIDLVNSIYIDWGTFINAVINFLLIAIVLFLIIKASHCRSRSKAQGSKGGRSGKRGSSRRRSCGSRSRKEGMTFEKGLQNSRSFFMSYY